MQQLIYYVAMSLDGFIARENGDFSDFTMDDEIITHFVETLGVFGTVLMGRNTYNIGLREGKANPYPMLDTYVLSRSLTQAKYKEVTILSTDFAETVMQLKEKAQKPIWLCGGSDVSAQFLKANLIDEIWVKVNPILLGQGIPLFRSQKLHSKLTCEDKVDFNSGVILLKYSVKDER
ncbi:MAG: dihydrofolate reductase family protein [Calditrichia bacterium]